MIGSQAITIFGGLCSRSHSTSSAFISRCKDVAGLACLLISQLACGIPLVLCFTNLSGHSYISLPLILVSSSHKLCGQLKVKLLLSVLVFTWYVLIVHWTYLDDEGLQDFQAYSLGEILMEHFPKVLIIVLFVCMSVCLYVCMSICLYVCVFVSVRFSSIYGACHCK